ncbi:hypothetical protein Dsin_005990 [Dipteronia sinensis]|uniref:Uncharacterized protein n=1 Tax=Dipteronia sinensis TaxID=43782 RepID=A0AAE0AYC9_9ROSI|nr:hypothetical protein Dsin_005990 [Dipteronia sinensis]
MSRICEEEFLHKKGKKRIHNLFESLKEGIRQFTSMFNGLAMSCSIQKRKSTERCGDDNGRGTVDAIAKDAKKIDLILSQNKGLDYLQDDVDVLNFSLRGANQRGRLSFT